MSGMAKKYLICPGVVRSRHDGELHRISAPMLIRLYGVDPQECVVEGKTLRGGRRMALVALYPREDGRYEVPS